MTARTFSENGNEDKTKDENISDLAETLLMMNSQISERGKRF